MKRSSPSSAGRVLAAVLLTMAFYGLAICAAVALLAVPVAEVVFFHDFLLWTTALCLAGAIAIVIAIWPRKDKFAPPGMLVDERDQPRLFALIKDVAERANQKLPTEVYLVPDGRAFVAERGGILGFGSRRVMGISFPLLQALNVAQFRGIVAQQFGAFYGGDTLLARWVNRTRAALERTSGSLSQSFFRVPFDWYARRFLRITDEVSNQQEYAADAFAVEIVGRETYAEALRTAQGIAAAFDDYWKTELIPVLVAGFRTPIAAGFELFLANPTIERKFDAAPASPIPIQNTDVRPTRPSTSDRLAAIAELPAGSPATNPQPAITLLDRLSDQELALLRFKFGADRAAKLRSISWQDAGRHVFVPLWRKTANEYAKVLRGVSIDQLPELARAPDALRQAIVAQAVEPLSAADQATAVEDALGAALAQSLAALNWEARALPGAAVELRQEVTVVTPFLEVRRWIHDAMAAEQWPSFCKELGIVEAPILWPEKGTVEVSLDELSSRIPLAKTKQPASPSKPTA